MIPILHNLFQKKGKETLPNSFHKINITLASKPDNDITRKEDYRPILLVNIDIKILKNY